MQRSFTISNSMICPHCQKEIADGNFNCPYCKKHIPPKSKGTGHATLGTFDEHPLKLRSYVSKEGKAMMRETDFVSTGDEDGYLAAAPSSETGFDRRNDE